MMLPNGKFELQFVHTQSHFGKWNKVSVQYRGAASEEWHDYDCAFIGHTNKEAQHVCNLLNAAYDAGRKYERNKHGWE